MLCGVPVSVTTAPSPAAGRRLNAEGGRVANLNGWRKVGVVVIALGLGGAVKLIRDMLKDLDRSEAGDPWGPHRKGF